MSELARHCRWSSRALAIAVAAFALGACVSVQVPRLPTGDLPAHWHNSPKLGAKPDLTGWWHHFDDATLNGLVETALADNPDVTQAAWKLRAARELEDVAGGEFKPQFSLQTDEKSNAANTTNYFQAGFDASWEIGLFGRSGASGHIAAADAGASAADLQSARVSLVAEVVREYLELRAAQREEALADAAAHTAARKLALVRGQARLQLATQIEVASTETQAEEAAAQLADPRTAVATAAQALAALLGRSEPDPAWLEPAPQPQLADANVVSVPADLLRTRPDIRYAEAQVVKAAGELGIATADLYPRLTLGGGITFAARVVGSHRLGTFNSIAGIGPFINIPLFGWGRRKAERDARSDLLQAAIAGYRKTVLAGAEQVETSLATLHNSGQRLAHVDAAVASSQRGLGLTRQLQQRGEADQLNLVTAKLAVDRVQLAQAQAQLQRGLAYVSLYKALGGAPLPTAGNPAPTAHQGP